VPIPSESNADWNISNLSSSAAEIHWMSLCQFLLARSHSKGRQDVRGRLKIRANAIHKRTPANMCNASWLNETECSMKSFPPVPGIHRDDERVPELAEHRLRRAA
jgi:hypothetical protein